MMHGDEVEPIRTSLQVAPLTIQKDFVNGLIKLGSQGCVAHVPAAFSYGLSEMTPPTTPDGSQEDLAISPDHYEPVFHSYLRARFHYEPPSPVTDSTITLPLAEGDLILIHSIHTNGWADGTLLETAARGWVPTNYCSAYHPEEMKNLLSALLNFWDLLRSTRTNEQDLFGNQEFLKGIVAGVRYLLERTHCLTRESALIQRHELLRRGRKGILSELSSLVKTSKRLQEKVKITCDPHDTEVNMFVDEMVLKAFKIVLKGMAFLDHFEEDRRERAPTVVTIMETVTEESSMELTSSEGVSTARKQSAIDDAATRTARTGVEEDSAGIRSAEVPQTNGAADSKQPSDQSPVNAATHRMSQKRRSLPRRLSASISHRVSLTGPSTRWAPTQDLVSERLSSCHDTFLSYLGSFIGRLHLQSQSRPDLARAIVQSGVAGQELLDVIDTVSRYNTFASASLEQARGAMYERIRDLVYSARDILDSSETDAEDVIMPHDNTTLLVAATECVKAAGDCVAKTKSVVERIGDFEFEKEEGSLGLDLSIFEKLAEKIGGQLGNPSSSRPQTPEKSSIAESKASTSTVSNLPPPRSALASVDKPLPEIPDVEKQLLQPESQQYSPSRSPSRLRAQSHSQDDTISIASSTLSISRPSLPPLPKLTTSLLPEDVADSPATAASHDSEYQISFRSETTLVSNASVTNVNLSRDSESSFASQISTRATTPDSFLASKDAGAGGIQNHEEVDEVESRLLERTYAHELMFNKEGQVTGGSLQALVERLTTHEATPDAAFVSTFYLTFRLFCTPAKLAESLIERFDYVAEAPHIANPVRLRIYNVMKGWLETHWRNEIDREALPIIQNFADCKLSPVLASAGKRLAELAERVSSTDGSLVPRLVSSMGKTSTSIAQFIPAETPMPNPVLSRSQLHLLNNWKSGGSMPSILDFDPIEFVRQLTRKQMTVFCSILPDELLGSRWTKKCGVDSPNVKSMVSLSTDLSNLVADSILNHPEPKKRAIVIKHWIKIAQQCLEINNYDGLMAIICSLNSSIISRLRKTWDMVSQRRRDLLKTLQEIVEPNNNNRVLRARLQGHVPPCLPFLGMYLTDLTFVDIGNPAMKQLHGSGSDEKSVTVVNFDKHMRTAKLVGELQRFQIPYRFTELPDFQEWLQAQLSRVKEADQGNMQGKYYRRSLFLEPREVLAPTPIEPVTSTSSQKADLFSWISRDRSHNAAAAAI